MKTCSKCKIGKPFECFGKRSAEPDGLHYYCKDCRIAISKNDRTRNIETLRQYDRNRYATDTAKRRAVSNRWKIQNPEKAHISLNEGHRKWKSANPEKAKQAGTDYWKKNLHKLARNCAKRRAAKLQATPMWADQAKIEEYYFAADFLGMVTGIWHHVDHIVPLQQDLVCGLHCEQNLQVLTEAENLAKGNRWWPDMPGA